jgi:hypothetical protein
LRVSLMASMPQAVGITDVDRPLLCAEAYWTTASTAFAEGAEASLPVGIAPASGYAYLMIEGTLQTLTRGLSECHLSARP